jgi:membrane fusion protein, multidrug efflux system
MKKWTFFMLLIALVLFGSVIGFNLFKQKMIAQFLANRPEPSNPVTVETVKSVDWTPTIEAVGFIEPKQGVTLTNQTSGVINDIAFNSGESVNKDHILLTLNADVEKANLKSAEARLPAAYAKYKRYKDLYQKGSISQESNDDARASYFSLAADIESLKAAIKKKTISAPFDGIVGIRNIYLGQYLKEGASIVRLEDVSRMRFHFTVPQTDISRIAQGQKVDILVDSYPNQTFRGSIQAIEPAVNAQSGLINIEADIPNNDGKLRSGMFARANILLGKLKNQVTVPQTAITYTLYGDSVYVVKQDEKEQRVEQRVVEVGEHRGNIAHILGGIKEGDVVVTSGQIRLSNGAKVHLVKSNATAPHAEIPML